MSKPLLSQLSNLSLDRFQLRFNFLNLTRLIRLSTCSLEKDLLLFLFLTQDFQTLFAFLVHD